MNELLAKPIPWDKLRNPIFVGKLVHISNYATMITRLKEPIDSIEKLAMFLAILRPGKKHLQGLTWDEISTMVWEKLSGEGYSFRKSHALAYSILISLQIRALAEAGY